MKDLLKGENTGVIVDIRPTDFRAGAETGLAYKPVNPSGDWTKYRSTDEWQRRNVNNVLGYDTNSCTDFSCLNSIEAQIERMLAEDEIPQETIDKMTSLGYFDDNGKINFNDWFNAITAGTNDTTGNTLYAAWDAVRNYGLIPQAAGAQVNDFTNATGWFGTKPTANEYALGKQFNTIFDVAYEWVSIGQLNQWDLFDYHLKQAPLHVLVPTGSTWNNTTVSNPTPVFTGVNHAIAILAQEDGVSHTALDHYNPFLKTLEWNYYIPYALKGVVSLKNPVPTQGFHYVFNVNLRYGAPDSPEVHKLQEALQALGLMKKGVFGPYGPQTRAAVGLFQTSKGIHDPDGQGTNFGPKTRQAVNSELAS